MCAGLHGQTVRSMTFRQQLPSGLSASPQVLLEDSLGYLWVGTTRGLYRYDGFVYLHIVRRDSGACDTVTALHQAPGGQLWVGFRNGDLAFVAGDSLTAFDPEEGLPRQRISGIATDPAGTRWFATYGEGLYFYTADRRMYSFSRTDWDINDDLYCLAQDDQGRIWVGSDQGIAICRADGGQKHYQRIGAGLPDEIVTSLCWDSLRGQMWAGLYEGALCRIGPDLRPVVHYRGSSPIVSLMVWGDELWLGTRKEGIVVLDAGTGLPVARIGRAQGYPATTVHALLGDREGNVWLADEREGLLAAQALLRRFPGPPHPGPGTGIRTLLASRAQVLWAAVDEALYRCDLRTAADPVWGAVPLPLAGSGGIISMYEDPQGRLWLGTFGRGVLRYDPQTRDGRWLDETSGLPNNSVLSISGSATAVWFATLGGPAHISPGMADRCQPLPGSERLGVNYVYQVLAGASGQVWLASDGKGLWQWRGDTLVSPGGGGALADAVIYSMSEGPDGRLWFVGQDTLLHVLAGGAFRAYGPAEGLTAAALSGVMVNRRGEVLVAHSQGVDVFDPQTQAFLHLREVQPPFDPDLNALSLDTGDGIWLGSQTGIYRYRSHNGVVRRRPAIRLHRVSVYFKEAVDTARHVLAYRDHHLTFAYAGLWYQQPDRVSYRYKLEGLDSAWVYTRDRQVSFPRLAAGSYRFRVQAALDGHFEPGAEAGYAFRIRQPFWLSPWFYLALLLVTGWVVWVLVRRREQRLRHEAELAREKIRFQFETLRNQVNPHFLFNSFNTLASLIDEDQTQAINYVNRLAELFRNILLYRDKAVITLREELHLLQPYLYLQQQRYGAKLHFDFDVAPGLLEHYLPPLTLQMLIENAIKHNVVSQARPLHIALRSDLAGQYLVVENPVQEKRSPAPSTGLGLANIRERYRLLSAQPVLIDQSEARFRVQVPLLAEPVDA
ncbi:MAG: hypothetical protein OHK0039_46350 [Bacteroidia bacterium]